MANNTPLITIAMTCYNAADTIQRAVNSALAQDLDNTEIIICDDCSSDTSPAILAKLESSHNKITIIRQSKNTGAAGARNAIIKQAKGEFIAFFDDDDESHPSRVRMQYEAIKTYASQKGVQMITCYASGKRLYPNGYSVNFHGPGHHGPAPHGSAMADQILFFGGKSGFDYGATPSCSLMMRRKDLQELGGFDQNLRRVEDLDLAVRFALSGGHFISTRNILLTQHATWAGDKTADANVAAEQAIAEKHQDYLKSKNRYYYALKWPQLRYFHFTRHYKSFALLFLKLWIRYPFSVTKHILKTGPARLKHEAKMQKD